MRGSQGLRACWSSRPGSSRFAKRARRRHRASAMPPVSNMTFSPLYGGSSRAGRRRLRRSRKFSPVSKPLQAAAEPSMRLDGIFGEGWDDIRKRELAPVAVAVLDSGVDASHPDLAGRVDGSYAVELDEAQR